MTTSHSIATFFTITGERNNQSGIKTSPIIVTS